MSVATSTHSFSDVFARISDALVEVKELLGNNEAARDSECVNILDQLAAYAESLSRAHHKAKKLPSYMADTLDREGVNLWNLSTFLKEDAEKRTLFASLRHAGFRLIEAGLEPTPGSETLIHLLQLASKAGAALSACGRQQAATEVLSCGAKFEEYLRDLGDDGQADNHSKASAILTYYIGRMDAAWEDNNENVAFFMLQQALNNQRQSRFTAVELGALASKVLDVGKSILKTATIHRHDPSTSQQIKSGDVDSAQKASIAVKWLQQAFQIVENAASSVDYSQEAGDASLKSTPVNLQIKRKILRALARAYFLSSELETDNLARAEAALKELNNLHTSQEDDNHSMAIGKEELQRLRWMFLAVLKRRHAGPRELVDAFKSILDSIIFNETNVMDIINELSSMAEKYRTAVTEMTQLCIKAAVNDEKAHEFVQRFMLSLLLHIKGEVNNAQGLADVESACASISAHSAIILDKTAANGCQSLIWIVADKLYAARNWSHAAKWFLLSAHPAFRALSSSSNAKCLRKAALCHIQQGEYAQASSVLVRCPGNEAATHYVAALAAAYQAAGSEEEATQAIDCMIKAPDFDRRMLLMITQLAHESQLRRILLKVLSALLQTLSSESKPASVVEGIVLIRCVIRLLISLWKEPEADKPAIAASLVDQLHIAQELVSGAFETNEAALIAKDLSWLWRTAYNSAIEGCIEWPPSTVAEVFSIAARLIELMQGSSVGELDGELPLYRVLASLAAVTARVFITRNSSAVPEELRQNILLELNSLQVLIRSAQRSTRDPVPEERFDVMMHLYFLYKIEQLCGLRQWGDVPKVLKEVTESNTSISIETFEAISDSLVLDRRKLPFRRYEEHLVWLVPRMTCRTILQHIVLLIALEAMLLACLNKSVLDIEKFSRWLRAICSILLTRNRPSDRVKALGYVEQAVEVMKDHVPDNGHNIEIAQIYPMDERRWIFTIAYNRGVECFSASLLDEAKRWFESATRLAPFLEDPNISNKVRIWRLFAKVVATIYMVTETYATLLSRFSTVS